MFVFKGTLIKSNLLKKKEFVGDLSVRIAGHKESLEILSSRFLNTNSLSSIQRVSFKDHFK